MRKIFYSLIFSLLSFSSTVLGEVMLLQTYTNQNVEGWVMSEKLDGVRGFWDGEKLYTRQEKELHPPHYFLKNFPPFPIDGELFIERNQFERLAGIVKSQKDKGWQEVVLHVFDVPKAKGNLFKRLQVLKDYLKENPTIHIQIIEQIPIQNKQQVDDFLKEIIAKQGEGIVVRNPNALYENKRSNQILKIKPVFDEECTVIAHHAGKGKFEGILGAISCQNDRGIFRIGSGFSNEERKNPPAIGTLITYQYRGLTSKGLPRFATFYRVREDFSERGREDRGEE